MKKAWAFAVAMMATGCGGAELDAAAPLDDESALTFAPDAAGGRAQLAGVVIPNLEASTGFTFSQGDNAARMSIVDRALKAALDTLSLPVPDTKRASSVLRAVAIPALEMSPGYQHIHANNPNSFHATKMGIARDGIDAAIRKLTGFTGSTSANWSVYPADSGGAKARITDVVLPQLMASTGFGLNTGDNLARMSIVKRELQIARDLLALPAPDPARARALLASSTIGILEGSPGFRRVRADHPGDFATTKMGVARAGLDFVLQKTAPSTPVFMEPGVFIVDGNLWSPGAKAAMLQQNHFGWVAVKIHHGPQIAGNEYLSQSLVAGYHAQGIQVGGWGYLTTDPVADAAVAAQQVNQWGLDFYLADAEAEYKLTSPSGAGDPVAYARSQQFVAAFRALEPTLPAAVSSFGARSDVEHLVDIDFAAWRAAGFDLMQQAYLNDYEFYRPSRCVRAALNDGWPINRVHPTFGIWGGGVTRLVSAQEYLDDVAGTGIFGFSTFIGDQMPDSEVTVLGGGVARGLAR